MFFASIFSIATFIESIFPANFLHQNFANNSPDIVFAGDIMLSRSVGAMTKKYGTDYVLSDFHPFKNEKNSLIFVNLESPFSERDRDTHEPSFYFASNPRNIVILENLFENNFAIVSLANNHIFNAGFDGFETTMKLLDEAKITHV